MNRGGLCARGQAGLQGLYDPDRVRDADGERDGDTWKAITWDEGLTLAARADRARAAASRIALRHRPRAPARSQRARRRVGDGGGRRAPGRTSRSRYETPARGQPPHLRRRRGAAATTSPRARFVISFGADFLETWGSPVGAGARLRRDARARRRLRALRHGRAAALDHRRQRRRVGRDPARQRDGAGARHGARDPDRGPGRATGAAPRRRGRGVHARGGRAADRRARRHDRGGWRAEFAARAPEPRGGRRHRRAERAVGRRCSPRSTCSTTSPATSARRCASIARSTSTRVASFTELQRLVATHGGGQRRRRWSCTAPIRSTPRRRGRASRRAHGQGAVQGLAVERARRDRRALRPDPAARRTRSRRSATPSPRAACTRSCSRRCSACRCSTRARPATR